MSTFWKIFITVILTAAVVGGGGYWYMNKKATSDKAKLQSQIDDLSKQVTELKSSSSTTTTDETANWKTYTNATYGFSFKYPSDWSKEEFGNNSQVIVSSADTKQLVDEGKLHPGYANNLVVTYYSTINSENARGGSWEGQRTYSNLADYFTDAKAAKQKTGETTVGGVKAYEVGITGLGGNFGIMIERSNGIYELSFERRTKKSELTQDEKNILSTFQFTK